VGSDGGEVVDGSQKSGTTELWVSSNTSSGDTEEAGSEDGLDNSARFEVTFESALLGEAGDEGHDRLGDGVGVVLDLLVVVVFVLEDDKLEEGEEGNEDHGPSGSGEEEVVVHSWSTDGLGTEEGSGMHTGSGVLEEECLPVSSDSHEGVWEINRSATDPSGNFAELDVSECPSIGRSNDGLAGLDSVSEVAESVAVVVGKASSGEPHPVRQSKSDSKMG